MENTTIRLPGLRRLKSLLAVPLLAGALLPTTAPAQTSAKPWVSTWGTGVTGTSNDFFFPGTSYNGNDVFNNQVVRLIVHASLGGGQVRIRLSNEFGAAALAIGSAHIALSDGAANIVPGTDRTLTFDGGGTSVTIPAGAPEISDLVDLDVPDNALLAVSLYFPASTTVTTGHPNSQENTYVSPAGSGDVTAAVALPLDATDPSILQWPLLSGVEVRAKKARVFVALGSSVTNGTLSTVDANHRWTDYLAQRFSRRGLRLGVVSASVVANALLHIISGGSALARFDRDVVARPGAAYVFINDVIGVELQGVDPTLTDVQYADQTIGELRQFITRAHSEGLTAYAGTVIPLGGATNFTPSYEARRQVVNAFIRGGGFDGYADFDAAVRDPTDLTRILPAYDGGDHHHLSDAGYKAVADSFDLALFE